MNSQTGCVKEAHMLHDFNNCGLQSCTLTGYQTVYLKTLRSIADSSGGYKEIIDSNASTG